MLAAGLCSPLAPPTTGEDRREGECSLSLPLLQIVTVWPTTEEEAPVNLLKTILVSPAPSTHTINKQAGRKSFEHIYKHIIFQPSYVLQEPNIGPGLSKRHTRIWYGYATADSYKYNVDIFVFTKLFLKCLW